eukprot:gene986-1505_t
MFVISVHRLVHVFVSISTLVSVDLQSGSLGAIFTVLAYDTPTNVVLRTAASPVGISPSAECPLTIRSLQSAILGSTTDPLAVAKPPLTSLASGVWPDSEGHSEDPEQQMLAQSRIRHGPAIGAFSTDFPAGMTGERCAADDLTASYPGVNKSKTPMRSLRHLYGGGTPSKDTSWLHPDGDSITSAQGLEMQKALGQNEGGVGLDGELIGAAGGMSTPLAGSGDNVMQVLNERMRILAQAEEDRDKRLDAELLNPLPADSPVAPRERPDEPPANLDNEVGVEDLDEAGSISHVAGREAVSVSETVCCGARLMYKVQPASLMYPLMNVTIAVANVTGGASAIVCRAGCDSDTQEAVAVPAGGLTSFQLEIESSPWYVGVSAEAQEGVGFTITAYMMNDPTVQNNVNLDEKDDADEKSDDIPAYMYVLYRRVKRAEMGARLGGNVRTAVWALAAFSAWYATERTKENLRQEFQPDSGGGTAVTESVNRVTTPSPGGLPTPSPGGPLAGYDDGITAPWRRQHLVIASAQGLIWQRVVITCP